MEILSAIPLTTGVLLVPYCISPSHGQTSHMFFSRCVFTCTTYKTSSISREAHSVVPACEYWPWSSSPSIITVGSGCLHGFGLGWLPRYPQVHLWLYAVFGGSNLVFRSSKWQSTVSCSSVEAEYGKVLWPTVLLRRIGFVNFYMSTTVRCSAHPCPLPQCLHRLLVHQPSLASTKKSCWDRSPIFVWAGCHWRCSCASSAIFTKGLYRVSDPVWISTLPTFWLGC
jgi:hypothetical protein